MRGNRRQYIIQAVIWLVVMVSAIFLLPNVSQLVRDKGQTKLPSSANSQVANVIQDHWGRGQNNTRQLVVVFSNGDKPLTTAQNADIQATINKFKNNKSEYYIKSMTAASDNAAAKKQLISKDKSTQLLQLLVSKKPTVTKLQNKITDGAKTTGVKSYITGGDILTNDFSTETEKGIQKTEVIAVIFIFFVLVLVFRSPIVPLISLLGVGVSFIVSLSLVMNLVSKFNFPLSNFTQVFMVVVLFGIGTDYNILLFDQFKEELSNGRDPVSATQNAVRVAGKTILYSGSSVLIGFTTLGLANFSVYRSAVGVAVGVAVLLVVLLTLNPFFMAVLGKRMFWPTKNFAGGSTSKMWHGLAKNSVLHPIISLIIVLAVTLPFILDANQQLNYDTTAELSPDLPSMVGFRTVQKHFSEGTAEPTSLYIKSDKKLNNEAALKEIDRLTRKLQKVDGVKTVASVTQPGGSSIEDLYVKNQLGTVTSGMKTAGKGLTKIGDGLDEANDKLKGADVKKGVDGAKKLADGTATAEKGSKALGAGADKLSSGADQLNSGVVTYANGVYQVNSGVQKMKSQAGALPGGINKLSSGSSQVTNGLGLLNSQTGQLTGGIQQLFNGASQETNGLGQLQSKTGTLQSGVSQLTDGAGKISGGLGQLNGKVGSLTSGASQLSNGASSLSNGLSQLNGKSQELVNSTNQVTSGAGKLKAGSDQLVTGLQRLNTSIQSAGPSGADQANVQKLVAGLRQITGALQQLQGLNVDTSKLGSLASAGNTLKDQGNATSGDFKNLVGLINNLPDNTAKQTPIDTGAIVGKVSGLNDDQKNQLTAALNDYNGTLNKNGANVDKGGLQSAAGKVGSDLQNMQNTANSLSSGAAELQNLSSSLDKLQSVKSSTSQLAAVPDQTADAITKLNSGIDQMKQGVNSAIVTGVNGQSLLGGAQQLSQGLNSLSSGSSQLASGVQQYTGKVGDAANGASQLNTGTQRLNSQVPQLVSGIGTLNSASSTLSAKMGVLNGQVPQLTGAIDKLFSGSNRISSGLGTLNGKTGQLSSGVSKLYNGSSQVTGGIGQLQAKVPQLIGGIDALSAGTSKLANNSGKLTSGASQLASGNKQLAGKTGELASGLATINNGQQTMYNQLNGLVGQMATLQDGLATAANGTNKINKGVGSANSYLTGLKKSDAAKEYYVPNSVLKGSTYKQALDNYLSGDDKATKMTIVLDTNPASKASMAKMDVLRAEVANNIKGTPLAGSTVALGGQTSQTNDTQKTASGDFLRTAAIMLAGILLALMFITRSILQPFYIIGTLLLAYISSLSLTRLFSGLVLHQDHLTWNTPFFSFIMLIALGVDYSIFLMMKYREFDNASATPANRIVRASAVIGAVVLSAAVILSGTFAALMPSGVLTLIQVALAVIIGLIILVVIIPMVIPSLIKLTYPLTDRMEDDDPKPETRSSRH